MGRTADGGIEPPTRHRKDTRDNTKTDRAREWYAGSNSRREILIKLQHHHYFGYGYDHLPLSNAPPRGLLPRRPQARSSTQAPIITPMKVIVTGSTGWVGNAVLKRCLSTAAVTSVISISRRDPGIRHAKLTSILHDDFSNYPARILDEMATADSCIYCLGTNVPAKPAELNRKINFEYALATARIFTSTSTATGTVTAVPAKRRSPVRFVYLSGALPERDPEKHLWLLAENRKMRGELENALLKLDEEKGSGASIYIARPGFVQPPGAHVRTWILGKLANAILQDELAAAMVHLALEGGPGPLVENAQLKAIARSVSGV